MPPRHAAPRAAGGQSRGSRVVLAAALVAGAALALAASLTRPAGPVLGEQTPSVQRTTAIALASAPLVTQRFEASEPDLSQVRMRFSVEDEVPPTCGVRASVATSWGEEVGARSVACAELEDLGLWSLDLAPQADSAGREYELRLEASGQVAGVWVWAGDSEAALPAVDVPGGDFAVSLELHPAYGNHRFAAQQVPLALDRISAYGPWWSAPAAVVALALACILAAVGVALARPSLALGLVLVFAAANGTLWSVVLPPLKAPDEVVHFAYVQFLAEQNRIPRRDHDHEGLATLSEQLRVLQDELNVLAAPPGDRPPFDATSRGEIPARVQAASPLSGGNAGSAGYAPHYYLPAAALYEASGASPIQLIHLARLWSVTLAVVATWLAVLVGRSLFPGAPRAALALGLAVTAQPMFSQQLSSVNNDALVVAAGFACLLAALELARPGAARRWVVIGALALGLAAVTKPFGVLYAPVLGAAWLVGRLRTAPSQRRPWPRDARGAVGALAVTYGSWAAVARWFDLPGVGLRATNADPGPKGLVEFLGASSENWFEPHRALWVEQFWGVFGWLDTPLPGWVYAVITVVGLATLAAAVAWLGRMALSALGARSAGGAPRLADLDAGIGICVLAVVAAVAVLAAAEFLLFRLTGRLELVQGRNALAVLPAVLALPALLLTRFVARVRPSLALGVLAAAMVGLNGLSLAVVTGRFYL